MHEIYYEQVNFSEPGRNELARVTTVKRPGHQSGYSHHCHVAVEVTLCINNPICLNMGGKTYEIPEGDFVYVNSGEVHATEALHMEQDVVALVILLSDQMFRSICPEFDRHRLVIPAGHPGRKEIAASLQKIYDCKMSPTPYGQALINSELWRIVYLMAAFLVPKEEQHLPAQEQRDFLARQAMEYIDRNFLLPELTLSMVAQKVGLQENYFCRYFKKYTGMSFSQYLAQARLRYALAYMLDFGASVVESALQAGFPSSKSFTDWCKRVYGVTPAQYKRQQTELKAQGTGE